MVKKTKNKKLNFNTTTIVFLFGAFVGFIQLFARRSQRSQKVKGPLGLINYFFLISLILILGLHLFFSMVIIIKIKPIRQRWPLKVRKDLVISLAVSRNQKRMILNTQLRFRKICLS